MILIALGANLESDFGSPLETIYKAIQAIEDISVRIIKVSRIYKAAPVPYEPDHPWYHNAVISIETSFTPHELLQELLNIEKDFGRVRTVKNAPRVLDLDLISYNDTILKDRDTLILPHPRMHKRLFVLKPLLEISNVWNHPVTGASIHDMMSNISDDQKIEVCSGRS